MAGRPWYAQGADLLHRVTELGVLGYSGYLTYVIGRTLKHNYEAKLLRQQAAAAATTTTAEIDLTESSNTSESCTDTRQSNPN